MPYKCLCRSGHDEPRAVNIVRLLMSIMSGVYDTYTCETSVWHGRDLLSCLAPGFCGECYANVNFGHYRGNICNQQSKPRQCDTSYANKAPLSYDNVNTIQIGAMEWNNLDAHMNDTKVWIGSHHRRHVRMHYKCSCRSGHDRTETNGSIDATWQW